MYMYMYIYKIFWKEKIKASKVNIKCNNKMYLKMLHIPSTQKLRLI